MNDHSTLPTPPTSASSASASTKPYPTSLSPHSPSTPCSHLESTSNPISHSQPSTAAAAPTTRIRDNQRRSRARRKTYLEELEAKVRAYEAKGVEVAGEIQAAARKVVEQNRELREENERLRRRVAEHERERASDEESHSRGGGRGGGRKGDVETGMKKGKVGGKRAEREDAGKVMCGFGGLRACTGKACEENNTTTATTASKRLKTAPGSALQSTTFAPTSPNDRTDNVYPSPPGSLHNSFNTSNHRSPPIPPTPVQAHNNPFPTRHPIAMSPTASSPTSLDDTSSCLFAAHIITSMRSDVSIDQVRSQLGCPDDGREEGGCEVDNKRLFNVMDRFA